MKGPVIPDVDYRNADLAGKSFADCTFWKGSFASANLRGAELSNVTFDGSDLSLAVFVDCALKDIRFKKCKLIGVDFRKCNAFILAMSFEGCLLDTCNFSQMKLPGAPFKDCVIRDCAFGETELQKADFSGSDLAGTIFQHADLRQANFVRARNYAIDPAGCKVKGAQFSLPEAISLLGAFGIELKNR